MKNREGGTGHPEGRPADPRNCSILVARPRTQDSTSATLSGGVLEYLCGEAYRLPTSRDRLPMSETVARRRWLSRSGNSKGGLYGRFAAEPRISRPSPPDHPKEPAAVARDVPPRLSLEGRED